MSNQKGFGVIELFMVLLIVCLIGAIGFVVYDRQTPKDAPANSKPTGNTSPSTKDPVLSSESKFKKSGYKDCGSADYSNVTEFSFSSYNEPEPLSDCFEDAFAHCEKAMYSVINLPIGPKGVTTRYSIEGMNSKNNKCRGGLTYVEHAQKEHVGTYGFCDLNQASKPFLKAYAEGFSGSSNELAERCEGTIATLSTQ